MNGSITCETCRDRLSPLMDGELESGELRSVREHLKTCPDCCRELALLTCTEAEAAQVANLAPSDDLWERIECSSILAHTTERAAPSSEILTLNEAALYLRLSTEELTEALDRLPYFRIAGQIRFRRRSLEAWIEAQEQNATPPEAAKDETRAPVGAVVDFVAARARLTRYGRT